MLYTITEFMFMLIRKLKVNFKWYNRITRITSF